MHELAVYFGISTSIVIVVLWIGIMIALAVIRKVVVAEKRRDRKATRGQRRNQTHQFTTAPHLHQEMRNLAMIGTLLVIYLTLLCPYLVRVKIDQINQVSK